MSQVNLTSICNRCRQVLYIELPFIDAVRKCKTAVDYSITGNNYRLTTSNCNNCNR